MKMINSIFTHGSLIILLLLFHSISIKAQEVDDEREFDYLEGSELGPEKWGELRPEWGTCKRGKMQSPIDISNPVQVTSKELLQTKYKAQNAIINNRGHDIMVRWEGDAGSILINEREFDLLQAHWHAPSEHAINGTRYAMELHMLHRSTDPKLTPTMVVVAVFYEIGDVDPFLSRLGPIMSSLIDQTNEHKQAGVINPMEIQLDDECYYKYIGSLTTPSCTEGVTWIINKRINTVSSDQVKLLREAVHDHAKNNARPLQALNHREVQLHCHKDRKD
uniref:Carbonic anhydrase Nec1 n=1 Tax=Nesocodon mauritianus TaxID=519296 RepID=NEC1_NESMA|nr:RecName: Full=Carbonic anhydrase Nec1; AltName: Full=Nectar protein 1; Short=NmNec1; Flags: Precursor [Nesocodon mauritianus]UIE54576.1 Nec1 [Nesocodon mauritianus]